MLTPSRNQPCPCGSGKKFKQCCAGKINTSELTTHRASKNTMLNLPERGTVPIQNGLQIAIQHHQLGQLRKASEIYQLILQKQPDHIDALHLHGVVMHQFGKHEIAYQLIKKAITLNPNISGFYNNLGEVCRAMSKLDEAISTYQKAISLQPNFPEAERNIGMTLLEQNKPDDALKRFKNAITLNPAYLDAYLILGETLHRQHNFEGALAIYREAQTFAPDNPSLLCQIGITLRANGQLNEAIQHYQQAITLQPGVSALYNNLAFIYETNGNRTEAASCYRKILELDPEDESTRHKLNALEQINSERAPPVYVRETFDFYASTFDQHLVEKLEYHTPEELASLIKQSFDECPPIGLDILDIGCGTGLFGLKVQSIKHQLTGLDLSPKMIEKARERGIYDFLHTTDLIDFIVSAKSAHYDLVVATDVFIYIGKLSIIFEQSCRILRPKSVFAFSIEVHCDDSHDFLLGQYGRYLHSVDYIKKLCEQYNFNLLKLVPTILRKQNGIPVEGCLCVLKKKE